MMNTKTLKLLIIIASMLLAFGFNTIDVCENNTVWAWEQIGIAPNMLMLEWHWYLIGLFCFGIGAFLLGYTLSKLYHKS